MTLYRFTNKDSEAIARVMFPSGMVPVELDYEAAEIAYSNHEPSKAIVDAAVGEETP